MLILLLISFVFGIAFYIWMQIITRPKRVVLVPLDERGRPVGPIIPSKIDELITGSGNEHDDYLTSEFARRRAFYEGKPPPKPRVAELAADAVLEQAQGPVSAAPVV